MNWKGYNRMRTEDALFEIMKSSLIIMISMIVIIAIVELIKGLRFRGLENKLKDKMKK